MGMKEKLPQDATHLSSTEETSETGGTGKDIYWETGPNASAAKNDWIDWIWLFGAFL